MKDRFRWVDVVLASLVVFDVGLVARTALDPGWWFADLNGMTAVDDMHRALLYRCAAHWTAFALFQSVALAVWRRRPHWLLIVAGLRFSDVFTDWTYLATSESVTTFGVVGLFLPGVANWSIAIALVWAWRRVSAGPDRNPAF